MSIPLIRQIIPHHDNTEQCPQCSSDNIKLSGPIDVAPIGQQLIDNACGTTRIYLAHRYFCYSCEALWDVVQVNEAKERLI